LSAQIIPDSTRQQGYWQTGDTTWFIFDEDFYQISDLDRVVVTGSFRAWSTDMEDPAWQLSRQADGIWTLMKVNPEFSVVPIRSEFKFRANEGNWLQPPANTPNEKGSNHVFLSHMTPPTLQAEIRASGKIWARTYSTDRPLDPKAWRLTDFRGREIPIADILPNLDNETLIIPAEKLDIRRVYYLELPAAHLKDHCSFEGWFRDLYSNKELGANVNEAGTKTAFRVFSPRAEAVKLYLYQGKDEQEAYQTLEMTRDPDGVWEAELEGNLIGTWYDFTVHGPGDEPGSHFYESLPVHVSDPYARVSDDTWGKCMVAAKTQPATPLAAGRPPMQDVISYEVHVQDFTDNLPVSDDMKGTLPAFHQKGLKNSQGEPVGFDYLVDLGINVVHLMPIQEFLHYPDENWRPAFENDSFMQEQGIAEENYQWGYRTSHCFAVETRFRQKNTPPGAEREQFRDLVQAFHDEGIAVIIDIVPNHTAENMDEDPYFFHWNVLGKQYHYRTKNLEHIGEYGNEVKTENRPMVQRWLIDQCQHWIDEFGIDGFRIDLAGQIDRQTLSKVRYALGPDVIIYGEPWIGSFDPDFEANPSWDWYKHNSPITFFQDDARNAFKGPTSPPHTWGPDHGFAGGDYHEHENVKRAITCTFPDDHTPNSGISYLDIHDNWALADRFALKNWDGRYGVHEDRYKIAALLLYTSCGPIVTHGGSEMMRSKGLAVLREDIKHMVDGSKVYLHGKRDTYNMRAANRFVWENVGKTKEDEDSHCDYQGMHAFWRGLNRFRLSEEYGSAFRIAETSPDGYYVWLDTVNPYQLGYVVAGKIMVLINTGSESHDWDEVYVPDGKWKLVGSNQGFDHFNGVNSPSAGWEESLQGGQKYKFSLPGTHFRVWIKE
ncbi:MAG: alpha-amylase family glycosyl hydrolase, partial [Bacteroidota bacterium]